VAKAARRSTEARKQKPVHSRQDAFRQMPSAKGRAAVRVAKARIKVGNVDISQPTVTGQKEVSFTLHLDAGKTQLSTWFYDKDGNELCSAYYTLVERK
jgi:hypothetical protein